MKLKRWSRCCGQDPKIKSDFPANLDDVPLGTTGRIVSITGERKLRRRLMEMGLLVGSRLRVVKFAPAGDPIQIKLNDYFLSLRRSEAAQIIIKPNGFSSDNEV